MALSTPQWHSKQIFNHKESMRNKKKPRKYRMKNKREGEERAQQTHNNTFACFN